MAKNHHQNRNPSQAKAFLDQTAKESEKDEAKESEEEGEKASETPKVDQPKSEVQKPMTEAKAEKVMPEVPGKYRKFQSLTKGKN